MQVSCKHVLFRILNPRVPHVRWLLRPYGKSQGLTDQKKASHVVKGTRAMPRREDFLNRIDARLDEADRDGRFACMLGRTDREAMGRLVHSGMLHSPYPGVFVHSELWQSLGIGEQQLRLARSLGAMHPDWTFCDATAALAHGLPVSHRQLSHVHVCHLGSGRHSRGLVRWHATDAGETTFASGIRVTSLERSAVDCLLSMDFGDGLAVADATLRRLESHTDSLDKALGRLGAGRRGIRQARLTLSHADPHSESGGESIARARMIELGFVVPELQVEFVDPLTGKGSRVDFLWRLSDGSMVVGELDGRQKYVDPAMTQGRDAVELLSAERLRESRLTRSARVVRFSFADVCNADYFERLLDSFRIPRRPGFRHV